jgi:hypothetical protein
VRSWQLRIERFAVNEAPVELDQGVVIVVLRPGDEVPGPTDWEVSVRSSAREQLAPGTYALRVELHDGTVLDGAAMLRFSDGRRHLFRGDATLEGFDAAV